MPELRESDKFTELRSANMRCNAEHRGSRCNKLLLKVQIYISALPEVIRQMQEKGLSFSEIIKSAEVKVGFETKCNRCKNVEYTLAVV